MTVCKKNPKTVNEAMQKLRTLMLQVSGMRQELKRRAMIYQCEEKEYVAARLGKKPDAFHNLPYVEWAKLRAKYGFHAPEDKNEPSV